MNKVLLVGRLTRDPEIRSLASGRSVTTFSLVTHEFMGPGHEATQYHAIVVWDRLAEICATYLGKNQMVAIEGRNQTRSWDDDNKRTHSRTEVVASMVEMLSGRSRKDMTAVVANEAARLAEEAKNQPVDA